MGYARRVEWAGGYELGELIGLGGSGSVWRANRAGLLDQPVAIKRVMATDSEAATRCRREATTLDALDHPHIVRIIEVVGNDDELAIVMPLARGGSLHDLLAERSLDGGEAVALFAPIADALASAHLAGVTHGDVKASNILLTGDGEPLLADFGLAQDPSSIDAEKVDQAETADVEALVGLILDSVGGRGKSVLTAAVRSGLPDEPGAHRLTAAMLAARLRSAVFAAEVRLPGPASARHPGGPVTREYGPRPPRSAEPEPSPLNRAPVAVAALAVAVLALGGLGLTRRESPVVPDVSVEPIAIAGRACPIESPVPAVAGATVLSVDLAGDGCPSSLRWRAGVVEIDGSAGEPRLRYDFTRYEDGRLPLREGELFVGDWDCDGAEGLALFDRARKVVHYFDHLPRRGELPTDAREPLTGSGPPRVVRTGGCDRVVRTG